MNVLAVGGILLIVLVAWDAAITVLHPDAEGLLAGGIRRVVWRVTAAVSTGVPRLGKPVLGLAGPVIVALTFVSWVGLITLGLALVIWPMLPHDFDVQGDLGSLGFLDALYFAGGTVTVLGYGDLTPVSPAGQLISVFAAAIGFTLFTGMATYAIEIVSGVATRNRFTLAVHDDVRGGGGATMLAECLAEAGAGETRERCRTWADYLRDVDELTHRFPLVAFTYRSDRAEYDPEVALRHVGEGTVAALLASAREPGLRGTAAALCSALTRLQRTIAEVYLDHGITARLNHPDPTDRDHQAVVAVERVLSAHVGPAADAASSSEVVELVFRCRIFLAGLHEWSGTGVPPHEWDG
ncbi:MAG: two pore domain potassium channel family protein [Actinophytocola sp.]|nr:two pore domain potassium channel family protein [Actinophytocola sp.]